MSLFYERSSFTIVYTAVVIMSEDNEQQVSPQTVEEEEVNEVVETPEPEHTGPRQKRLDDFDVNPEAIGEGAFGKVYEVEDKETHVKYAMKVLNKQHIMKEKKINYVKLERDVLAKLRHPNIIKLILTFQNPANLYYVVELAPNGDLQHVLNEKYTLDIPCTAVLTGQVLLAISHMHKNRIIHRDLKPENILLDSKNRVKVTDFGTSKMFGADEPFQVERGSFVGTADYVCPETLNEKPVGPASDLWSFGCILYTLLVGVPPFRTESNYATFQKIENLDYTIPDFVPVHARDLISKLLVIEPEKRLGYGEYETNYESIREHPFYAFVGDWDTLDTRPTPEFEPFLPALSARKASAETEATANGEEATPKSTTMVPELLMMNETSILEGMVKKRRKVFSVKKRRLVLTSKPRLFYVDMGNKAIMGDITLSKDVKVTLEKGKKFKIEVPGRIYDLSSEDVSPEEWKEAIEKVVAQLP